MYQKKRILKKVSEIIDIKTKMNDKICENLKLSEQIKNYYERIFAIVAMERKLFRFRENFIPMGNKGEEF